MCFKRQKKKRKSPIKYWGKAKEKEKILNQRLEDSKKKIPDQRSEESKSKIYRKVVGPGNVWIMYRIVTSKKEKKRNHDLRHMKLPLWLPTKSLCPRRFRAALNKKNSREGKGRNTQNQIPPPKSNFLNALIIHDYSCYLWFDRKWFTKSSHDISMVRN